MHPLSRERLPRALSLVLAVFTGLLLGAGYAPMGIWPATIVGVGLFTWLVAGRTPWRAAGLGAVAGLAMNSLTIHWIGVLGVPVAIALVAFMSLWSALLGAMVALLTRLRLWVLWVPCAWVAVELAGGRVPFGGFPWIRLAYTTVDQPLSGWLPWVGSAGVSFLLALVAQLGLEAVRSRRNRLRTLVAAVALVVVGGSLKWLPQASPEQQVTIGVVQGNVNRYLHGTPYYAASVTDNMLSETVFLLASQRATGAAALDFIVWPENATDVDPLRHPAIRQLVDTSVALAGVPIFVGAVMDGPEPDTRQTSSIWWTPDTGPGDRYDKRNLVPFGEYIPFRDVLLPRLPVLEQIGRQSIAGIGPGVVAAPTADHTFLRVGDVICFELAWDDTVYDTVLAGADIIVTQSNTNTYGGTFEVPQQLALNRVRAMELGREVVVSTLNSLTGLVDASGTFHDSTAEFTAAHRTFTVPLRTNINMAVRLNPWLGWALAVVGVGATLWAGLRRRTSGASDRLPRQSSASIGSTP
ncbi:apolipoprotein N-acyltransferase [Tessaracoccus antarcticus]|uniref:Apolipoprotein N-acyltransferase n=1 Tax=Tessaracoccus antarcticus TaxID=2479848 RepID=A0A3M0G6K8_9ACTN|nr:apolipoprotein N-acyltransferase [Tessaracoccus antarcticus]RMB60148.1 apolipoprotein N-acyltransferase [Tessaracoccus antarcticus]